MTRYQVRLAGWKLIGVMSGPLLKGIRVLVRWVSDFLSELKSAQAERELNEEWDLAVDRYLRGPH